MKIETNLVLAEEAYINRQLNAPIWSWGGKAKAVSTTICHLERSQQNQKRIKAKQYNLRRHIQKSGNGKKDEDDPVFLVNSESTHNKYT